MSIETIIAIVGIVLGGGGVGAFVLSRAQARKADAEASVLVTSEEWRRLTHVVDTLQEENDRLCKRIEVLEKSDAEKTLELNRLRLGVVVLIQQLRQAGIEPEWTP